MGGLSVLAKTKTSKPKKTVKQEGKEEFNLEDALMQIFNPILREGLKGYIQTNKLVVRTQKEYDEVYKQFIGDE